MPGRVGDEATGEIFGHIPEGSDHRPPAGLVEHE
jgi:hypothetical protein